MMSTPLFTRQRAWIALPVLGVVIALAVSGALPVAVEEPGFAVALHQGAFEIREYPATVVAEVTVTGDQRGAAGKGFRLLAGYIFGGNTRHQSIAMTAPVAQQPRGETIAMTAPVTQIPADGAWVVRFTMPSAYSLATLPRPNDQRVTLRQMPPSRFVVVRFSGFASPSSVAAKTAELTAFARAHNLQTVGPATLAQYNPPWTLWFLRRNEVMLQLAG